MLSFLRQQLLRAAAARELIAAGEDPALMLSYVVARSASVLTASLAPPPDIGGVERALVLRDAGLSIAQTATVLGTTDAAVRRLLRGGAAASSKGRRRRRARA